MAVAFVLFVIVKILPSYKSPPSHTTGKIRLDESVSSDYAFRNDGKAWIVGVGNETLSVLEIEIASTVLEIDKGLMYRKSMNMNNGMLFVFRAVELQSFWMKNTYIPLDIIFTDAAGVITQIHENTVPKSVKPITANQPIKYVLEVNSGFVAKNGIQLGSKLTFEKN